MTKQVTEEEGTFVFHTQLIMPYRYAVGKVGSRFIRELRNKRIMGLRCPTCGITYVPPRLTCGKCFNSLTDWVQVGNQGILMTYTVVYYQEPIHPLKAPFAYGIIQLDGADTGIVHLLGEVNLETIQIGMRVEAVFSDECRGNILDIKYFKPV